MTLVRWDPFREMEEMSDRINRLMTQWPVGGERLVSADWAPIVDIQETEKEYLVKAELPEVKKEDVKVAIKAGVLTIEGERKREAEEKGKRFHRIERSYGKFLRSFSMPADADETKVHADYKDGVLNVHVARQAKATPKAIEVKVA